MFLFLGLIGCSLIDKNNDPMCDAICDEQYLFGFSKSLEAYSLKVSFQTAEVETDSIQVVFSGTPASAASATQEISIRADSEGIQLLAAYGHVLDNFVFEINDTDLFPSFIDAADNELCGSVCTISDHSLNTDTVEALSAEPTIIEELSNLYACATSAVVGDLFIVAHNDDFTQALIVHETDGYDVPGGGYWENGFNNPNLSVELHFGTNVGYNYCTDSFMDAEIAEVFLPLDSSELPEDLFEDEFIAFDYGPNFPECEDCVPYALVYVENFWFRSVQNNHAKVELINHLQSDILLNFGG